MRSCQDGASSRSAVADPDMCRRRGDVVRCSQLRPFPSGYAHERRWVSMPLPRLAVLFAAALVAFVPSTLANHPQAAHGDVIVFDHRTGNEWWVEVLVSGGASGSVSGIQAMDDSGPW